MILTRLSRRGLLAMSLCGATAATAQDASPPPDSTTSATKNTLVPLPVLFYQPETGTGFGAVASYYFRAGGRPTMHVPPSEIGGLAVYTSRKQILTSLSTRLYLSRGAVRLRGSFSFAKFPTKFWGIGNNTANTPEENYTPVTFSALGEALREVRSGWFAGGRLQVAHRTLRELSDSGQLVTGTVPGSANGRIVEASLLVNLDTRDNTIYPTRGRYYQIGLLGASTALGSNFGYAGARLDLRDYTSRGGRVVLGLRVLAEVRSGTPPFDLLPQLGGDVLLRGYYQGRFRDQVLLAAQSEVRVRAIWRIGFVAFGEIGQVAPAVGHLRFNAYKTSVGGGIRFLLVPREGLNLRADYGYGVDVKSGGFYLGIGEAF